MRAILIVIVGLAIAAAAIALMVSRWPDEPAPPPPEQPGEAPAAAKSFPLPTTSESSYLNTRPDAKPIGTAACAKCHVSNHESYLHTAHSRALADIDANAEPPDGSFEHKLSGRTYRVFRKDGQLHHEESLRMEDGREVGRIELPVRYLVGSGHFSRTYLVEVDGFLHESPITWYASKKKWDMSPGYDTPQPSGFERPVGPDCMACHTGGTEPVAGAAHRLTIREKAIGCENCHGPGSTHQEFHQLKKLAAGQTDLTIVNPGKLPRELREDICSECHQSGPARVAVRGRWHTDFRPGLPLSDFSVNYRLDHDSSQMTVVGHVEQLHASACYQKSTELSCTTCHDPHTRQVLKDRTEFFRQKCLDCHAKQPCRVSVAERTKKEPADNCVACHMPRGDTEIPHIAFTHHRIGRHGAKPPSPERVPNLIPCGGISRLSAIDQQRNLGLAYLEASRTTSNAAYAAAFRARARDNLVAVLAAGLNDGMAAAGCAELYWTEDPLRARRYAQQALDANDVPPTVRAACLMVLAYGDVQIRNFPAAVAPLEEMVRLRRFADDWRLLGMSYLRANDAQKAIPALQKALSIRPFRPTIHAGLAETYGQLGDARRAEEHLEKSRWLRAHNQD